MVSCLAIIVNGSLSTDVPNGSSSEMVDEVVLLDLLRLPSFRTFRLSITCVRTTDEIWLKNRKFVKKCQSTNRHCHRFQRMVNHLGNRKILFADRWFSILDYAMPLNEFHSMSFLLFGIIGGDLPVGGHVSLDCCEKHLLRYLINKEKLSFCEHKQNDNREEFFSNVTHTQYHSHNTHVYTAKENHFGILNVTLSIIADEPAL